MPTDQELIRQIMAGDADRFEELVVRYERQVYNLAVRMLHDPVEAEDAAQEAFLRAYRYLNRYDPSRSFKTWIMSIASNHCIDRLRRRVQQFSLDDMLPSHPVFNSGEPNPEEHLVASERADNVTRMLEKLSPRYRTVVVLYYWDGMSCSEIADILNVREGTIKSRLFRARRQMATQLKSARTYTRMVAPGTAH